MTSGTVHVWTIALDVDAAQASAQLDLLSGEERVRAARLRTTEARLQFILVHGVVRTILGQYAGTAPRDLRIETTPSGKPVLGGGGYAFSLAHSDALAVCAVSAGGQLGVDLERIRPAPDADAIVRRYFARAEVAEYEQLPAEERLAGFYSLWTRKEAFVKATGEGLQIPLDSFEVELAPGSATPRLVNHRALPGGAAFHLHAFSPSPGYLAAVALDRPIDGIQQFEWSGGLSAGAEHLRGYSDFPEPGGAFGTSPKPRH